MSILKYAGHSVQPQSILKDAKLDWNVVKTGGVHAHYTDTSGNISTAFTTEKNLTVRSDTGMVLGVVGNEYKVVQNSELEYLAQAITKTNNLKVSSAGALRGGSRVWIAVEAPSFSVGSEEDVIHPYLLLSNGHDGLNSLSGTPTSIRVWCENTLNMALEAGKNTGSMLSIRHKGDMESKLSSMAEVLSRFFIRVDNLKTASNYLADVYLDRYKINDYFDTIYSRYVNVSIKDPTRAENRRVSIKKAWLDTYATESHALGSNSAWIAMNAVTNWIDHHTSYRGEGKTERKFINNIYGDNADTKQKILTETLSLV